jgi:hypothetical protein
MTECSETLFPFEAHFSRQVVTQFEGSWLTTEGGALLLRQADRKIDLLRRFGEPVGLKSGLEAPSLNSIS